MLKLYFAPMTRALRVRWLLEELELPYVLETREFRPTVDVFFAQGTPTGKFPTLEDGDIILCESGAIVEYILERYGDGRLAPPIGSPERAAHLQWLHFAESTAFPPLGILAWLGRYRSDAGQYAGHYAELISDTRARAAAGLEFLRIGLGEKEWILGSEFGAADVMLGFTLAAARMFEVLDDRFPTLLAYLGRLQERPAFRRAVGPA